MKHLYNLVLLVLGGIEFIYRILLFAGCALLYYPLRAIIEADKFDAAFKPYLWTLVERPA